MPEVLLVSAAADEFQNLSPALRKRARQLLDQLEKAPDRLKPLMIPSALLNTALFMVRAPRLRLLYEINRNRAVVLGIHTKNSKTPVAKRSPAFISRRMR